MTGPASSKQASYLVSYAGNRKGARSSSACDSSFPKHPPPSQAWARDREEGGAGRADPLGKRPPTLKTRASLLAVLQVQPAQDGRTGSMLSSVLTFKGAWHGAQEGLIIPQSPNQGQNHY